MTITVMVAQNISLSLFIDFHFLFHGLDVYHHQIGEFFEELVAATVAFAEIVVPLAVVLVDNIAQFAEFVVTHAVFFVVECCHYFFTSGEVHYAFSFHVISSGSNNKLENEMPRPDGSNWSLEYEDERSNTRVLISLPMAMLKDAQAAAKLEQVSTSEFIRRALSERVKSKADAHPYFKAKLRGKAR